MADFRLKVFDAVARHLSFTRAARELYVSQPAISKHIQELEAEYGCRLFERQGSRIALTAAGRLLQEHGTRILEAYRRAEYEMNLLRNEHAGTLRLGASTTIAQYVLPALLADFIRKFSSIRVSLFSGNSSEVEEALREHRIDLGLVEGVSRSAGLKYTDYLEDELVAVVPASSRMNLPDEITVERLREIPLVLRERGSGTLDVVETALAVHGIVLSDLNVLMYLGSTESIKRFLEHTDAMGIVSVRAVDRELLSGALRVVDIRDVEMPRIFSFCTLQGVEDGQAGFFMEYARTAR